MLITSKTANHFVASAIALSLCIFSAVTSTAADSHNSTADKVLRKAESLLNTVKDVHYEHLHSPANRQIDGCVAHNDCSGFVSYLLSKYAPAQYLTISSEQPNKSYPQAKIYAKFFSQLESEQSEQLKQCARSERSEQSAQFAHTSRVRTTSGWLKVYNFHDLKRGDFIAWAKVVEPGQKPGNSGHVAIVVEPPGNVEEETINEKQVRFIAIKVIDSSSVDHFPPDFLPPNAGQKHRDGLGEGFVKIILDADDHAIGYWEGTYWNEGNKPIKAPSYTPTIGFARLVSLRN